MSKLGKHFANPGEKEFSPGKYICLIKGLK